jgi:hypothetical protein
MDAIFSQESRDKALQEEIGDCMKCDDAELSNALQIFDPKTCKLLIGAMIRRDYQVVGELFCLAWADYCDSVAAQIEEPKQ